MTNSVNNKMRRFTWLSLTLMLVVTACSGNTTQTNNSALNTTSLEARQSPAAQAEMPKAAAAAPAVKGYLPAEQAPLNVSREVSAIASGAAKVGGLSAGAAPAAMAAEPFAAADALEQPVAEQGAALARQIDAPQVQVDLSLPQEPKVGSRAPNFSLQTLDGQTVTLADLVGRPVVISYWATWCVPCKQELPILQRLNDQYRDQGLVVLTVNAIDQDALDDVQAQVAAMGLTTPVLLDTGSVFAGAYQAAFFPSTYFIDPSGVIRSIKLGDSAEDDLTNKIQSLLAGSL